MTLSLLKIEEQDLSSDDPFIFNFDGEGTLQQYIVGLAYFKLSYGEEHNYEFSKMALSLSNSRTGSSGKSIATSVTAILQDDDHSINLSDSYVSLSAIGDVGTGPDYNVQLGTLYKIASGTTETKICDNASEPVRTAAVMMSGFSMAYTSAIHRFWNAQTDLTSDDKKDDGLYASITGYCKNDDNDETDENIFDLIGITTSTAQTPPLLIKRWKGQSSASNSTVEVDFSDILQDGYVIDVVRVFISDFCVYYADRTATSSTDHEITAIGAGCKWWNGSGGTVVTLAEPCAFVYQTGFGEDKQDDSNSYVELVIVVTQRPA